LVGVEAQAGVGGEGSGLVKHVQVADGELLVDAFRYFERQVLLFVGAVVVGHLDGAGSSLGLNTELDKLLGGLDGEGLVEGVEFLADLGELAGVDGHDGGVLGVGDGEVLLVEGDEVHGELGDTLGLGVLEDEFQVAWVVLGLEGDGVTGVGELHDLGEGGNAETKDHGSIGTVVLEALRGEVERDQGDVGSIHSLEGQTSCADVNVDFADHILDGLDNFLEDSSF
jgi:hypothetical protein